MTAIPVTTNAAQRVFAGGIEAFVVRLSRGGAWQYATHLGGTGNEAATAVVASADGRTYVTGWSNGGGFPATSDAYRSTAYNVESNDAWVAALEAAGAIEYATYYGGTASETPNAIDIDLWGVPVITGETFGTVPVTTDAFQADRRGITDAFIASVWGRNLRYGTRLGGSSADRASGIAVHQAGRITVGGHTQSPDFPTKTALSMERTCGGTSCADGFVTQLATNLPGGAGSVSFDTSGPQTVRVQTRENGISIDQIFLSTYHEFPPGRAKDDTLILPR